MKVVTFLIVLGCSSPVEPVASGTVVYKAPCAAFLDVPVGNPFKVAQEPNVISGGASATRKAPKAASASLARPAKARKRLSRLCGTERPVWYTNRDGKRKYRCR